MFSQNAEEEHILTYFNDHIGTFLDIGANDGVTFSNTRALALKGWRGVCVEPSPKAYEKLHTLYRDHKGVYTYPYALSDHNGSKSLRESGTLLKNGDTGLVSTFHDEEENRFKSVVGYQSVEVKTFRWKTFLNRLKIKQFDMISLDIEGHEMMVLPQLDLMNVQLLVIEWNSKPELKTEYEKYLCGFNLIYTSAENLIYGR